MDFSFKKDKDEKLTGPRRNYMGQAPTPRGSEGEAPTSAKSFCIPRLGYSQNHLQGTKGTLLAVPVEEHGLHQGDDVSARVMTCTHDGHLQELGRGHQVIRSPLLH